MYTVKEVKNVRSYNTGYEVRTEVIDGESINSKKDIVVKAAYDKATGLYIGDPKFAQLIYVRNKIVPSAISLNSLVASIGFRKKGKVWFGWNQRFIRGFSVGQTIEENDIMAKIVEPGSQIKSEEQARNLAIEFVKLIS